MAKFPSLGENTTVPDILKKSPDAGAALMEVHEEVMRGPSPLSEGERELISAYVSKLNECSYCYGVHSHTAEAYGFAMPAIESLFEGLDQADVDDRLKPILNYVGKLTKRPSSVTEADAQAVYDAGWDEQALHDAIMVACTFNFMNRLLEGHGIHGNAALFRDRGPMLKQHGYRPLIRLLKPRVPAAQ
ncbi:MAG: peroxidase [Alphaproteobacteria bacterium HGW-Alphaproteobacteria-2]|nr:MAG: peroxidase [Alphaproteobacteria bacterium HGW-Alphaproteobacteria-2]